MTARQRAWLVLFAAVSGGCGDDFIQQDASTTGDPPVDPACLPDITELDEAEAPPIYTPRWAFEPWISKDISNRDDTYAFVDGFIERDIPVGVVVLDSPWETNYNTFVPNPERYPDFAGMVGDLRSRDVRIVLWVTQMVNRASFDLELGGDVYDGEADNFVFGQQCGFFINEGQTYGWWKGVGAGVDFHDEHAQAWWHRQQDALLEMGINGWKLDFGESYIIGDTVETDAGTISHQEYSEAYYEDFFAYGAAKRGADEFVTMVRPYDKSYEFEGRFFARPEHAPVAWVGDNRRDWVGLSDALDHIFRSAAAGYVMVGSDLGGYLDRDDADVLGTEIPPDADVFAAWTGVAALTPFMQLHGRANLTPWTLPGVGDELVPAYRYWSKLHHELVPFFYSLSRVAYETPGMTIVRPVGDEPSWAGDYRFHVGEAFLVAPPLDGSGAREIVLPDDAEYYDWWDPTAPPHGAGAVLAVDTSDRARIPLFVRRGAIIPASVGDDVTGLGTEASAGALTLLVYPSESATVFSVLEDDGSTTDIEAVQVGLGVDIELSRALMPVILRVWAEVPPDSVSIEGVPLPDRVTRAALDAAADGYFYDDATRVTWIKAPASGGARTFAMVGAPP